MFIAVLFMPLKRRFAKWNWPEWISMTVVVLIFIAGLRIGGELISISTNELMSADQSFRDKAALKIDNLITTLENSFGFAEGELLTKLSGDGTMNAAANVLNKIQGSLVTFLMMLFFAILMIGGSLNIQNILEKTVFKSRIKAVKTFMSIEKDIITFIKVKFIISAFTGLGFSLCCLAFGVSFPVFWGLFAFGINFVQMIGSVISVILLAIFAFVELELGLQLGLFVFSCAMVQVIMGGILEPVFLGKSFKINVVTVLVMLMFWGFIWGIPGLILSIPITVFLKIIFDQFKGTKMISEIIS